MSNQHIDVHYVAKLARIELTPEETAAFSPQLDHIVAHVNKLQELEISAPAAEPQAVSGKAHPSNQLRADLPVAGLCHQDALANAPASEEGEFVMPKIVE